MNSSTLNGRRQEARPNNNLIVFCLRVNKITLILAGEAHPNGAVQPEENFGEFLPRIVESRCLQQGKGTIAWVELQPGKKAHINCIFVAIRVPHF